MNLITTRDTSFTGIQLSASERVKGSRSRYKAKIDIRHVYVPIS